ncbi:hypothetical protein U1Q18_032110 [Sarracenia purpurea var. burkii]
MNDQSQIMNQSQLMSQSQVMMNHQPSQGPQFMNQNSQVMSQSQFMRNPLQAQGTSQSQMMKRRYGMWPPPPTSMDVMKFPNPMKQHGFIASKSRNWKGKKGNDKRKNGRKKEKPVIAGGGGSSGAGGGGGGGVGGYKPPTLNELQHQNRMKARKFYTKKKYNRFAPYAPRNTTSFIIRAKKSGGIASLISPCPVTPAVLPTPIFSPSREVLGDMAKEEWGVDGYGSMKGLIRLRSPGHEADAHEDDEEEEGGGSSESDVEEHVEVERRLDHDLSRFEMIYPNYGVDYNNVLENRVDDQDSHIAQLEEENLILKERLFLMESELGDLRMRLQCLERQNRRLEEINEDVVENFSGNESEGREDVHFKEEVVEENEGAEVDPKGQHNNPENECLRNVFMEECADTQHVLIPENQPKDEELDMVD